MFDDYILYNLEQLCSIEVSDEILADIRGMAKVSTISKVREETNYMLSSDFTGDTDSTDVIAGTEPQSMYSL